MNSVSRQHNESGRARCIAFSLGRARLAERSANDKAFRDCRRPAECETAGSRLQSESGHARYAFSNVAVILSGRDSPRAPGILTRFVTEHDFLSHSFPGDGSLRPFGVPCFKTLPCKYFQFANSIPRVDIVSAEMASSNYRRFLHHVTCGSADYHELTRKQRADHRRNRRAMNIASKTEAALDQLKLA